MGDQTFKEEYPEAYEEVKQPFIKVAYEGVWHRRECVWCWQPSLQDRGSAAQDVMGDLIDLVQVHEVSITYLFGWIFNL